tara:strand:+ start:828 stop:1118 length:291 start_codon:yes stop_codon:yes gene_type:complete
MENRIDINDLYAAIQKNGGLNGMEEFDSVCAELKRMYEKEDKLLGWIEGTITEAKDYVYYDEEDEMWRYDESKSGNPALDAMDFVCDLSTTDLKSI